MSISRLCCLHVTGLPDLIKHHCSLVYFCGNHLKLTRDIFTNNQHTTGLPPFPQIDIIGAMVIVWRVRGKIIRSVLCNIVRNNCEQCNAHTYERT